MPEHDNKNTGGAWATKAVKGSLDVQGRKYYIDIVQTGRESPAPLYNMYATSADTKKLYACGLFPPKGESTAKAKGVLNLYDCGGEFWINLFVNEPDPEHLTRPVVGLTVQAKAQETAAPPPPQPASTDKIPF